MFTFSILLSQSVSPTTGQLTRLVLLGILAVFFKIAPAGITQFAIPAVLHKATITRNPSAQFHEIIAKPKPFTGQYWVGPRRVKDGHYFCEFSFFVYFVSNNKFLGLFKTLMQLKIFHKLNIIYSDINVVLYFNDFEIQPFLPL